MRKLDACVRIIAVAASDALELSTLLLLLTTTLILLCVSTLVLLFAFVAVLVLVVASLSRLSTRECEDLRTAVKKANTRVCEMLKTL